MIPLFDLHCDTLNEMYRKSLSFCSSSLHISQEKTNCYYPYVQICAIWSDWHLSNEDSFDEYKNCLEYCKNLGFDFTAPKRRFMLSVEDARLLNGSTERIEQLFNDGVVSLTLNWRGESCIGGGWDTCMPLTPFGQDVVKLCNEKQIAVDLSHSSFQTQAQVLDLSSKFDVSPIFSHSNSFSVCNHKRNISDEIAKEISNRNGLIGLSLCCDHLSTKDTASTSTVLAHAYHFLDIGCTGCLALGCDFDGVTSLPNDIRGVEDLTKLYALFTKEFGTKITNDIFYNNSFNYFSKLLEGR